MGTLSVSSAHVAGGVQQRGILCEDALGPEREAQEQRRGILRRCLGVPLRIPLGRAGGGESSVGAVFSLRGDVCANARASILPAILDLPRDRVVSAGLAGGGGDNGPRNHGPVRPPPAGERPPSGAFPLFLAGA